jgi:putative FmdB family regulatory protein
MSVPIYTYVCKDCGKDLEVRQDFHDAALTVCPHCGGQLRKAFTAVGVVFKGSGFYRNDSREQVKQPEKAATGSSDGRADSAAKTSSSEKGSDKSAAKSDSGSSSGSTSSSPARTGS